MSEEPEDFDEAMSNVATDCNRENIERLLRIAAKKPPMDQEEAVNLIHKMSDYKKSTVEDQLKAVKEEIEEEEEEENIPDYEIAKIVEIIPEVGTDYREYIFHVEVEGDRYKIRLDTNMLMGPQEFKKRVFELTHTKIPIGQDEWDEFLNEEFEDLIEETRKQEPISSENDVVQEIFQSLSGLEAAETKDDLIRQPDSKYYCNGDDVLVSSHLINKIKSNISRNVGMRRIRNLLDGYLTKNTKNIGQNVRVWFFDKDKLMDDGVEIDYEEN